MTEASPSEYPKQLTPVVLGVKTSAGGSPTKNVSIKVQLSESVMVNA